jgi:5'-nucleotidase
MALHRDIHWVGRQWAVTGYGIQACDQKQKGQFDIEGSKLWETGAQDSLRAQKWFNVEDFERALSVARKYFPQPARIAEPSEMAVSPPGSEVMPTDLPKPVLEALRNRGFGARFVRVWRVRTHLSMPCEKWAAMAFSSEVCSGSREENASKQRIKASVLIQSEPKRLKGIEKQKACPPMRILCTNDDGIHAEGLKIVERIARALSDDVWIVAPELDQSGVSHSLSLNDPLRLREVGPRHFAVRGTPTDCVIMGARHILGAKLPDLVLSGVNKGRNVAEDVVYSGTIAGALEGTILGLPSFALSQEFTPQSRENPLWDTALHFGPSIIRKVIDAGVPKNTVINVNFPACPSGEVAGVRVTRQGKRNLGFLKVDQRRDGRGNPYFWIGFEKLAQTDEPAEGTDLWALASHYVSVTPLRLDRTDEAFSEALKATLK